MNYRRGLHGIEDLFHRVADRQDVTGRVLQAVTLPGVHQGRRVRQEVAVDHHLVEGGRDLPDRRLARSEEHTSELQSLAYLVCRLLLEKKKNHRSIITYSRQR